MGSTDANSRPARVLVCVPTRGDAGVLERLIVRDGVEASFCADVEALSDRIGSGDVVVVSEEMLGSEGVAMLRDALASQPEWSEVPVLLLTIDGESQTALEARQQLQGVLLFDRPVTLAALDTSLRLALRSRQRQYRVCDLLEERGQLNAELERRVTALQMSEARQAFLLRLGDALRTSTDAAFVEAEACRRVGDHLGADRTYYADVFEDEGIWFIRHDHARNGLTSLVGRYSVDDFVETVTALRSGKPVVINDTRTSPMLPDQKRSAYLALDIRAFASAPLIREGKLVRTLNVTSATPREWTQNEVALVQEVAERTWAEVERARAEAALHVSEEKYRTLFDSIDQAFCIIEVLFDADGKPQDYRFLEVNPAFEKHTGLVNAAGKTVRELVPDHDAHWFETYGRIALTGVPERFEDRAEALGRYYDVYAFRIGAPEERRVAILFSDISERKKAEERLRQLQKLESVGLLAGGIAHDFNNLLTTIMGNASMVLEEHEPEPAERLETIIRSAERGADLTRQLLAYAGQGEVIVRDLDVVHEVSEIGDLLQSSIPKSIALKINLEKRLPLVRMDPSQLQQILMNLVINAGEAIGEGNPGSITVSTTVSEVVTPFIDATGQALASGRYVLIEVADTGTGMSEDTKSKVFDPFFTTKFTGRGLGLAAVAGIVRKQKGAITVDSTPGHGATFRVLLPAAERRMEVSKSTGRETWRATVLVIDDEPGVREFIASVLSRRGYRVLTASNGREALTVCEKDGDVDFAIIDVVMPKMGARELLPALKSSYPKVTVLLTSGYGESEAKRLCAAYPGTAFIQKPYTGQQIAKALEDLLTRKR